jgi:hypothetical protein
MEEDVEIQVVSIKRFWVVTRPTATSQLRDILLECTFESYAQQIRGSMKEESIVGLYLDESCARRVAVGLLQARNWQSQP